MTSHNNCHSSVFDCSPAYPTNMSIFSDLSSRSVGSCHLILSLRVVGSIPSVDVFPIVRTISSFRTFPVTVATCFFAEVSLSRFSLTCQFSSYQLSRNYQFNYTLLIIMPITCYAEQWEKQK